MYQETGARSFIDDNPMQYRFLVLLSRHNHMSSAKALDIDICRVTEVHLPDQIVRYILHYYVRRTRCHAQCPVLTEQHRAVPFNFVRQHHNWQSRHWRPVLFTDENSFTESTNDRRAMVWRSQGESYADCNIVEVERYKEGSS